MCLCLRVGVGACIYKEVVKGFRSDKPILQKRSKIIKKNRCLVTWSDIRKCFWPRNFTSSFRISPIHQKFSTSYNVKIFSYSNLSQKTDLSTLYRFRLVDTQKHIFLLCFYDFKLKINMPMNLYFYKDY